MRADSLKLIWLWALLFMSGAFLSLYRAELHMSESLQGDLIFADNLGNIPAFSKIVIEISEKQVSLQKDENLWRIIEADNYYASFSKVQSLLDNISSARLGKEIVKPAAEIIWKNVRLFNDQEQEITSLAIGKPLNQDVYYVRRPQETKIYLSTWKMELPDNLFSWTRQPLLDFKAKDIAGIEKNNQTISRRDESAAFYNEQRDMPYTSKNYLRIFESLTDLYYEKVLSSQEFSPEQYPYKQTIQLTTFEGLITTLIIYTDQKEYWLQINLSANRLPSNQTTQYIAQNSILYQDWWFKIDDTDGQALFNFRF